MGLRAEGMAFVETKTDANPNFWKEFADKIRAEGYLWRYDNFFTQTNTVNAIKDEIIYMINSNSEHNINPGFILFNFCEHEYEYAFYDREQYNEEDIINVLKNAWNNKYPEDKAEI